MHWVAGTRHVAVRVIVSGLDPQDVKLVGATVRLIVPGLLDFAVRSMFVVLRLHVKESEALPVPDVPGNVMVSGLTAQVALGAACWAKPTAM